MFAYAPVSQESKERKVLEKSPFRTRLSCLGTKEEKRRIECQVF
jgi:hypothetical protein